MASTGPAPTSSSVLPDGLQVHGYQSLGDGEMFILASAAQASIETFLFRHERRGNP